MKYRPHSTTSTPTSSRGNRTRVGRKDAGVSGESVSVSWNAALSRRGLNKNRSASIGAISCKAPFYTGIFSFESLFRQSNVTWLLPRVHFARGPAPKVYLRKWISQNRTCSILRKSHVRLVYGKRLSEEKFTAWKGPKKSKGDFPTAAAAYRISFVPWTINTCS